MTAAVIPMPPAATEHDARERLAELRAAQRHLDARVAAGAWTVDDARRVVAAYDAFKTAFCQRWPG